MRQKISCHTAERMHGIACRAVGRQHDQIRLLARGDLEQSLACAGVAQDQRSHARAVTGQALAQAFEVATPGELELRCELGA